MSRLASWVLGTTLFATPQVPARPGQPDWLRWDPKTKTVQLTVVAGLDRSNNGWNFNGYARGAMTVAVPLGTRVKVFFVVRDGGATHSVGVVVPVTPVPSAGDGVRPAFTGATSVPFVRGSAVGPTQSFEFNADKVGTFWLFCGVPPHGQTGMWDYFKVARGLAAPRVEVKRT